MKLFKNV